ncbi:hypothetical protein [Glaciecola petra]|uniref:Lipoprotein n=1 Tax=Glaciecola petra TaxID=3075602 RepID=A0ABU2ZKY2_9ALTE|nr:hypothetical protein [Aestuariibacter sp. P117]MDT0593277.1 hypothetical protein [Aestuariibacter sp. P117]
MNTSVVKNFSLITIIAFLAGCASYDYPGEVELGAPLISFTGQSLEGETINIPNDLAGEKTILIFGYVQDSQFDIDRWLIGLDMLEIAAPVYEVPTIKGMAPRMFSTTIDNGMRRGIPKELWKGVVTVYADGDRVQQYTGNTNPNNSRIIVINEQGAVVYFYDRGFQVSALKEVHAFFK